MPEVVTEKSLVQHGVRAAEPLGIGEGEEVVDGDDLAPREDGRACCQRDQRRASGLSGQARLQVDPLGVARTPSLRRSDLNSAGDDVEQTIGDLGRISLLSGDGLGPEVSVNGEDGDPRPRDGGPAFR